MKDRYLFKAKRIDNGEWVQGSYLYDYGRNIHYIFANEIVCPNCINDCRKEFSLQDYEVDPSTICRCTGLKDKNGKLIWEKDIMRHYNNPSKPDIYDVGLILFQDHSPGFKRTSKMCDDNVFIRMDCVYEVIGNVFDTPELLEV